MKNSLTKLSLKQVLILKDIAPWFHIPQIISCFILTPKSILRD